MKCRFPVFDRGKGCGFVKIVGAQCDGSFYNSIFGRFLKRVVQVDGVGCHFLLEEAEGEVAEGSVGIGRNRDFATTSYEGKYQDQRYYKDLFMNFH